MEYTINLGAWKSVFAVPSEIVDKHIKLAGAAQLKVILWVLRHAGEGFSAEDMARSLSMHEADVRDSLQYWVQTGVIALHDNEIYPAEPPVIAAEDTEDKTVSAPDPQPVSENNIPLKEVPAAKSRPMTRPEKPDHKYTAERINSDPDISFLMQSADEIFGRMIGMNDKSTLLFIHEYDGLPVEVIIMLLQYAFSAGKGNMRYIEKMAINWADEEINTIQAAEKKIKALTNSRTAAIRVQRILGLDEHSPTEKELELAELWINKWMYSDEMIRQAYEICVDQKGKYIPKYIGSIIENWHSAGITEVSQIKQYQNKKKKKSGFEAAYNIDEYESTSVLSEEDL